MASRSHRGSSGGHNYRGRSGRKDYRRDTPVVSKKPANDVDENSPIIKSFRLYQKELDSRNDRHERLVKLSRDITIESKRIIFHLQRVPGSEDKQALLTEAADKLKELHMSKFLPLAQELKGQDPYQFLRAFSPGLQEYIEAVTFYHYLLSQELIGVEKVQADLIFPNTAEETETQPDNTGDGQAEDNVVESDKVTQEGSDLNNSSDKSQLPSQMSTDQQTQSLPSAFTKLSSMDKCLTDVQVFVPPVEYMLGVADFTGELMRMAINSVGSGNLETPKEVAEIMRVIQTAFVSFNHVPRELRRKTSTLRQSLQKVENACYALRVRGSEIPKHMLADVFSSAPSTMNETDSFMHDNDEMAA